MLGIYFGKETRKGEENRAYTNKENEQRVRPTKQKLKTTQEKKRENVGKTTTRERSERTNGIENVGMKVVSAK